MHSQREIVHGFDDHDGGQENLEWVGFGRRAGWGSPAVSIQALVGVDGGELLDLLPVFVQDEPPPCVGRGTTRKTHQRKHKNGHDE